MGNSLQGNQGLYDIDLLAMAGDQKIVPDLQQGQIPNPMDNNYFAENRSDGKLQANNQARDMNVRKSNHKCSKCSNI